MKRTVTAIALALILALALAACGAKGGEEDVQIPTPWTEYDSLDEALSASGLELNAPEAINGVPQSGWRVFNDGMLQIDYAGDFTLRMAAGDGDISGDYSAYEHEESAAADGVTVTLKGNGDTVSLALWHSGGYSYSLSAGNGLGAAEMLTIVSGIMA